MSLDLTDAIAELRRLNAFPLPHALPTEAEVRDAEARAGVIFHDDFRRYLLEASDVVYGTIEPVTIFHGHMEFGTVLQDARDVGVPSEMVPSAR